MVCVSLWLGLRTLQANGHYSSVEEAYKNDKGFLLSYEREGEWEGQGSCKWASHLMKLPLPVLSCPFCLCTSIFPRLSNMAASTQSVALSKASGVVGAR